MHGVSRARGRFRAASPQALAGFATETLPSRDPVGLHATWRYRPAAEIVEHLEEPLRLILAGNRSSLDGRAAGLEQIMAAGHRERPAPPATSTPP